MNLATSHVRDALHLMDKLEDALKSLPDGPEWGGGLHLVLPAVIPLHDDARESGTVLAWLVANDFNGYDLTTTDPNPPEGSTGDA